METDYLFLMMETDYASESSEPYSTDEYAWTDKSVMFFPNYFK